MAPSLTSYKWEIESLKQTWNSLFHENYYNVHNDDLDIQSLFLLLVCTFEKFQQFANRFTNTSETHKKLLVELEEKTNEIEALKKEISKNNDCEKCCKLEIQLSDAKQKSNEAQNRMNSIAKILCLGNLDSNDNEKRNSALTIVSQMLLDASPKRKRRCTGKKDSPVKENILVPGTIGTLTDGFCMKLNENEHVTIPETIHHSPFKPITNSPSVTPSKKIHSNTQHNRLSSSINLPIGTKSSNQAKIKTNLSADCLPYEDDNEVIVGSPPIQKKPSRLAFNIDIDNVSLNKNHHSTSKLSDTSLDATLLEYVKDSRSELDKIWFGDDNENGRQVLKQGKCTLKTDEEMNRIIEETPLGAGQVKKKRADFWVLKEKRELSNSDNSKSIFGKKLRQTKLELGVKPKPVDISKLAGFNGGIQQKPFDKDDDIILGSPTSENCGGTLEINEIYSQGFHPLASSTQRSVQNGVNLIFNGPSTSDKEPNYVYKRDAVRKKSERAKLPGWDCDECRKYYGGLSLNPTEVKARMNACSRHRDKFKPKLNDTPPGFWNPLFPDTQECREKGLYISVHKGATSDS